MSANKYQFSVYMNSPQKTVKIDIPNYLQNKNIKFIVSSVIAKMKTTTSALFIHSDALRSQELLYTLTNANSLISTTVATNVVSNPIDQYLEVGSVGFEWPKSLIYGGEIDFTLKDQLDNLLTDIDFAVITIDVAEIYTATTLFD